uniref:Uncharacterized protein n=1 Tax=Avena sativa TaxID=4498 RepID=A0ACD5U233_AVESA
MASSAASVLALLLLAAAAAREADGYVAYNTSAGTVSGLLNVHLVPHSHDDVGWLKTVDQYFVGSNNSIQGACVMNTLDSVVDALARDPGRKFVVAEQAFFQRWWVEKSPNIQAIVHDLVDSGQLEFINGGWCMHDEAATHYIDMIDQTTLGHRVIKQQFNKTPRAGWQIDPFGHSAVQSYLLGAELGFDSVHFARIDYQDRAVRKQNKGLEVIWRGSRTFGSSSQIFTNAFPVHYSPPNGFGFEVLDDISPVQDDLLLFDYNVEQRVNDFVSAAIAQANVTRTNHIMWTMGDDFNYQYAESWFRNMDRLIHYVNKVDLPIQQSFLWYGSSTGDVIDSQASGAYIFRPDGDTPTAVSRSVPLKVIRGPLVDEVHQQFSSWISQVTRLYKDKDHAEVEYTIGPIPVNDGIGKEVITRLTANMVTNSTFYTDSNGRDFLKRVRNYREDWDLQVTQPVAGNYYPVNLGMYVADGKYELSVLVDRSVGASSIRDGQIEIMLHRRILHDDGRGVGEPLDEVVCVDNKCDGLTAKGTYYVNVNKLGHGAHWRRTTGQEVYSPFLLGFAHEDEKSWKSYSIGKGSMMDAKYSLPDNVAIITLQNIDDGTVLLRLAHLFQAEEDPKNSVMAKVELKKLFGKRKIKELTETNLSANQKKSEMKKLNWRVVGDTESGPAPIVGGPVDGQALVVELGPMEIRTFSLKF